MKKLKSLIPGYERISLTALIYMLSVLCVCVRNIIDRGPDAVIYCSFFIELLGLVIICELIDWLVFRFIRNWTAALIVECILIILVCCAVAIWRGWIELTPAGILIYALIVLAIFSAVVVILTRRNRQDAEAINKQIQSE